MNLLEKLAEKEEKEVRQKSETINLHRAFPNIEQPPYIAIGDGI